MLKKKKIYPTYVSKHNSNCEKEVILLMIPNGEEWHYLAVKKLLALTSKENGDFYCLNCLHSFRTKSKLESHKKISENKDFRNIINHSADLKMLEFNQYKKSVKAQFIVYADLEYLIEKIDGCKDNPKNSSATKVGEHIPSGFSMSKILPCKGIENKHGVCRR